MRQRILNGIKKIWAIRGWVLMGIIVIGLAAVLVVGVIEYDWPTGFDSETKTVGPDEVYRPGKTLWDWLDLLIIPAVLALGALWANRVAQQHEHRRAERENATEREIASDRNQEAALQNYLDRMTELLLTEGLRASQPDDEVRTVARTRTLTVLRGLGPERKKSVILFLIEAGLVSCQKTEDGASAPIVSLAAVDLSEAILGNVNLQGQNLESANLQGAYLRQANLQGSRLAEANLQDAYLEGANLQSADLRKANLHGVCLMGANLEFADLQGANLQGAILAGAELQGANLRWTRLQGANLEFADLKDANLEFADLKDAILAGANLQGANLEDVTLPNDVGWDFLYDMRQFGVKFGPEGAPPDDPPAGNTATHNAPLTNSDESG